MTDSRDSDVAALKTRAEELQREQSRMEAQAEAADAERRRLLERMESEFGVSSREEAEELLAKLDAELDAEIAKVRKALEESREDS